ncbi:MAG: phosphoribosylamine--glycine ligase [Ferruginibacter sp.]
MNILLLGSGGREHVLAWKIHQSPLCKKLVICPGNAGTLQYGKNCTLDISDFAAIKSLCVKEKIELVVVGPELPLVNGIHDYFANDKKLAGIKFIGPSKMAAQLEGSKAFAKSFMKRHSIPTAAYREFTVDNFNEGLQYIKEHSLPVVLKADGLASGKGVLICMNHIEALAEFELVIMRAKFGEAGNRVVIEEFLEGIEMSLFVLTDGSEYVMLPEAKDYKRIGEGDTGLNTGGMGAVSPVPFFTGELKKNIEASIIAPTVAGLQQDEFKYTGFIFIGLMVKDTEAWVIEYNCRLGDPESEVVIPRLQNDLVELLIAAAENKLSGIRIKIDPRAVATVMAVSGGYPGPFKTGKEITGIDQNEIEGSMIFHAGTKMENKKTVTSGGRVLAVTSYGDSIREAAEQSNYVMDHLHFDEMNYRTDIGNEFFNETVSNVNG